MSGRSRPAIEKILERREVDANGCWIWPGAVAGGDYGKVRDVDGTLVLAHRVTWAAFRGPIPDGLEIDHLCRVPRCCNPAHLEPVTPSENNRRKPRRTHCKWGHEVETHGRTRASGRWDCRLCTAERVRRHRRGLGRDGAGALTEEGR